MIVNAVGINFNLTGIAHPTVEGYLLSDQGKKIKCDVSKDESGNIVFSLTEPIEETVIDPNKINEVAEKIHASMSDGDHYDLPFTCKDPYVKCEEKYGDIYLNEIDELINAVILYTLEKSKDYDY